MRGRPTWVVGLLCLVGLALVVVNTLPRKAQAPRGVAAGAPLPPFAVPLATSRRRCGGKPCDANVARKAGSGARGSRPACEVRASDILNSCAMAERGPVALAFMTARSERCEQQVDVLDSLHDRFAGVQLAAIAVGGDVSALRETIRRRGWKLPVGYDHDGAVASLYAVALCPAVTFARRGGEVQGTSLELLDRAALAGRLKALDGP